MELTPLIPPEKLCRSFSLLEILSATDNFDDSLIIGKGGFGKVYRGTTKQGTVVAIKRMNYSMSTKHGESQFRTEIQMLSNFRHSHVVSLIGYCFSARECILVYEYMNNGSLADHLYITPKREGACTLSWVQRILICIGAARGLDYLHTGTCNFVQDGVIHRDVKTSNILLDHRWVARVSDFGLSKVCPIDKSYVRTGVKGTRSYIDPDYFSTGRLRKKSDVYSFGVVLLEVVRGRRARHIALDDDEFSLHKWMWRVMKEDQIYQIVDPNLVQEILPESLTKFVEIVEQCLCYSLRRRPTMTQVVAALETVLALQLGTGKESFSCEEELEIFGNHGDCALGETVKSESGDKIIQSCAKPERNAFFKKLLSLIVCRQSS